MSIILAKKWFVNFLNNFIVFLISFSFNIAFIAKYN